MAVTPIPLSPSPWEPRFLSLEILLLWAFHINGIIGYVSPLQSGRFIQHKVL